MKFSIENRDAAWNAASRSGGVSIGPAVRFASASTHTVPPLTRNINAEPPSSTMTKANTNDANAIG